MFYNSQGMVEVQQPLKDMAQESSFSPLSSSVNFKTLQHEAEMKLSAAAQSEDLVLKVEAEKEQDIVDSASAEDSVSNASTPSVRADKEVNGGYENLSCLSNLFKEPKTREDRIQKNPGQARRRALKRMKQLGQQEGGAEDSSSSSSTSSSTSSTPLEQQNQQTQPQAQLQQTQPQPLPQQQPLSQPQASKPARQQRQSKSRSPKQSEPQPQSQPLLQLQPQLAHELQATVSVSSVAALLKEILLENAKEIAAIQQQQHQSQQQQQPQPQPQPQPDTRPAGRSDQPDWRRQHQPLQKKQQRQPRQNKQKEGVSQPQSQPHQQQHQSSQRPPLVKQPSHLQQLIEKHLSASILEKPSPPAATEEVKVKAAPVLM